MNCRGGIFNSSNGNTIALMKSIPRFCFAILSILAFAGCDKAPGPQHTDRPPARKYTLSIPEHFKTVEYSDDLANWTNSLLKNLGYSRSRNTCIEFVQTDIPLYESGNRIEGAVYVSRDNSRLFLVSRGELIVDFDRRVVGTGGCGGMSKHATPSGRMWVILVPSQRQSIYGVTLGDEKMDAAEPSFGKGSAVTYFYH